MPQNIFKFILKLLLVSITTPTLSFSESHLKINSLKKMKTGQSFYFQILKNSQQTLILQDHNKETLFYFTGDCVIPNSIEKGKLIYFLTINAQTIQDEFCLQHISQTQTYKPQDLGFSNFYNSVLSISIPGIMAKKLFTHTDLKTYTQTGHNLKDDNIYLFYQVLNTDLHTPSGLNGFWRLAFENTIYLPPKYQNSYKYSNLYQLNKSIGLLKQIGKQIPQATYGLPLAPYKIEKPEHFSFDWLRKNPTNNTYNEYSEDNHYISSFFKSYQNTSYIYNYFDLNELIKDRGIFFVYNPCSKANTWAICYTLLSPNLPYFLTSFNFKTNQTELRTLSNSEFMSSNATYGKHFLSYAHVSHRKSVNNNSNPIVTASNHTQMPTYNTSPLYFENPNSEKTNSSTPVPVPVPVPVPNIIQPTKTSQQDNKLCSYDINQQSLNSKSIQSLLPLNRVPESISDSFALLKPLKPHPTLAFLNTTYPPYHKGNPHAGADYDLGVSTIHSFISGCLVQASYDRGLGNFIVLHTTLNFKYEGIAAAKPITLLISHLKNSSIYKQRTEEVNAMPLSKRQHLYINHIDSPIILGIEGKTGYTNGKPHVHIELIEGLYLFDTNPDSRGRKNIFTRKKSSVWADHKNVDDLLF